MTNFTSVSQESRALEIVLNHERFPQDAWLLSPSLFCGKKKQEMYNID